MSTGAVSYRVLASCSVGGVSVQKLQSTTSGIVVCLAQVEGPLVNGYFCLATEAHDHDGLPHTLEHLIFMGSEKYPYKGVLDLLANRCLAQGTNAWTDVDHTCYTMTTAGSEGFLNLLPIYLDHIIYPTLTDAAFLTEVHHVNGEGDDAGVVYCEMQARENGCEDKTHFHLQQHMYPGHCGYRSETGGRLENLRTSCSNEKVRAYHRSFYRPDNLCLIVTGQVGADELFKAMGPFEEKIVNKGSLPPMERPWQSPVPPLERSVCEVVPFPTDEEGEGMARIAWRGPKATDRYNFTAMGALLEYLTETSVAPLQRDLVEVSDPFCSDVQQLVLENAVSCVGFTLVGMPTGKLDKVKDKVLGILSGIANGAEEVDMNRMQSVIKRQILTRLNQLEELPYFYFAFAIIGDFLFSRSPEELSVYMDQIPHLRKLLEEPVSFWVEMTKRYFVDRPHVAVLGSPSHELSEKMSSEEKERCQRQREGLGEEGLRGKAGELEKAVQQNDITVPGDVISTLPVPSTDSIHFHPLVAMGNHRPANEIQALPEYGKFPVHSVPFFFQVDHIHSAFVELTAILDTAPVPQELKAYIPLYLELLFESPIVRDGELVPYEEVVKGLAADTVATSSSLGYRGRRFSSGQYSQAVFITIKVEAEKYSRGVRWLQEILYQLQFTAERLTVVAQKVVNDVARMKRNGAHVAKTLLRNVVFMKESNYNLNSMVTQLQLLNSVLAKLKDPSSTEQLLRDMTRVQDTLTSPDNLRVVMATNVNTLPSPLDPWKDFLVKPAIQSSISPATIPKILSSRNFSAGVQGQTLMAGVGGVESNFLVQSVPCVKLHDHPDLPVIMVFMEYLCCLEGPMWRQIRGMGLSYHYSMSCKPEDGLLYFVLFKSSQLVQAYEVARKIVNGFVTGETPFEHVQLESAVSGVIYETIQLEKTVADAANQSVLRYLHQVGDSYSKWMLDAVSHVSVDDLRRVGSQYFSQLLDPSLANTAVCCNPSKVTEVKAGLEKIGHKVETVEDLDTMAAT